MRPPWPSAPIIIGQRRQCNRGFPETQQRCADADARGLLTRDLRGHLEDLFVGLHVRVAALLDDGSTLIGLEFHVQQRGDLIYGRPEVVEKVRTRCDELTAEAERLRRHLDSLDG